MKTSRTIIAYLMVTLFVSCAKDEYARIGNPIRIHVDGVTTKTLTDIDELKTNGFILDAWVSDVYVNYQLDPKNIITDQHYIKSDGTANVKFTSPNWTIKDSPCQVVGKDYTTRFWARYPASVKGTLDVSEPATATSETIQFNYKMPASASAENSDDIVFAYSDKVFSGEKDKAEDEILLDFKHAMSEIRFAVNTTDDTFDTNLEIKTIIISGLKSQGNCSFAQPSTFTWSSLSGSSSMSQDYDARFTPSIDGNWETEVNGNNIGYPSYFVIPQSTSGLKVTITFSNGKSESDPEYNEADAVVDLENDTLLAGKYYTYKINAKASVLPQTVFESVSLTKLNNSHENYIDAGDMEF